MNWKIFFSAFLLVPVFMSYSSTDIDQSDLVQVYPESFQISVENPISVKRIDEPLVFCIRKIKEIHPEFNAKSFVVLSGNKELASQVNDLNRDDEMDQIIFIANYASSEKKTVISGIPKQSYLKDRT